MSRVLMLGTWYGCSCSGNCTMAATGFVRVCRDARPSDGLTWTLRLLGTHVLIVGKTGARKGSVLWWLIRALGPAVREGSVVLWVIDPKGGMELAAGQALFTRYCYGDRTTDDDGQRLAFQTEYAEFLESLVDRMRARQQDLRGIFRTHKARPGDPHVVVLIDELAALTSYVSDRKVKARIEDALNLPRCVWTPVRADEDELPEYRHVLLAALRERQPWRTEYEQAKERAGPRLTELSATNQPATAAA